MIGEKWNGMEETWMWDVHTSKGMIEMNTMIIKHSVAFEPFFSLLHWL